MFSDWLLVTNAIAESSTEMTTQVLEDNFGNIIDISGIIVTLLGIVISSIVTWLVSKKSNKEMKLTYSMRTLPLFADSLAKEGKFDLDKLKIIYEGNELHNPYLLSVHIANTGNMAIIKPTIKIRTRDDTPIMPGCFEEIPAGYEDKWRLESCSQASCCSIYLEHINPNQVVHVHFFLDKKPERDVSFECAMPDLQISSTTDSLKGAEWPSPTRTINSYIKVNVILGILILGFFISVELWYDLLRAFIYASHLERYLDPSQVILFIFSVLVLTLIFNVGGLKHIDQIVRTKRKTARILCLLLLLLCLLLTVLMVFNIIGGFIMQIVTAIFVVVCSSVVLHMFIVF